MLIIAETLGKPLAMVFVGYDQDLLNLTLRGFFVFSFPFFLPELRFTDLPFLLRSITA